MIESKLLEEKYRIQKKIVTECTTVKEYLNRSHRAAEEIAKLYGVSLQYIELPNNAVRYTTCSKTTNR